MQEISNANLKLVELPSDITHCTSYFTNHCTSYFTSYFTNYSIHQPLHQLLHQISPATSPQPVHQLLHQLLHRSLLVRGSCMVRRYFVSLLGFDDGASAWVGGWLG
jgi:hypothetical protein